jgi:hypothetical protein
MPDLGADLPGGLISSPWVGTAGITVADQAGVTRVQLGQIGSSFGQNYGLKVVSSDGSTVIIDGTSDMFRIAATGTVGLNLPANTPDTPTDTTLPGLGTFSTPPALMSANTSDTTSLLANRFMGQNRLPSLGFVAGTSGGAVNIQANVSPGQAQNASIRLNGSNQVVVTYWAINAGPTGLPNTGMRYWVLAQVAI